MKLGVLVPTRGDRPELLEHARHMFNRQTAKPYRVLIADWTAPHKQSDIRRRLKLGCERLFDAGCTHVAIWEDDDWYAPNYIELVFFYLNEGCDLLGCRRTWYYGLHARAYLDLPHDGRASMHTTVLSRAVFDGFPWKGQEDKGLDIKLWRWAQGFNGVTKTLYTLDAPVVLSMKQHCQGMTITGSQQVGQGPGFWRFQDPNHDQLRKWLANDAKSLEFYKRLSERVRR